MEWMEQRDNTAQQPSTFHVDGRRKQLLIPLKGDIAEMPNRKCRVAPAQGLVSGD